MKEDEAMGASGYGKKGLQNPFRESERGGITFTWKRLSIAEC